jgi:hypothetical protein
MSEQNLSAGDETLERLGARVAAAQDALLAPLSANHRRNLLRLLTVLAEHHGSLPRGWSAED